jgi:hypothetical protein
MAKRQRGAPFRGARTWPPQFLPWHYLQAPQKALTHDGPFEDEQNYRTQKRLCFPVAAQTKRF